MNKKIQKKLLYILHWCVNSKLPLRTKYKKNSVKRNTDLSPESPLVSLLMRIFDTNDVEFLASKAAL